MAALFDDCDEKLQIGLNSAYATRYDTWREKEELAKLKARYGDGATLDGFDEGSSSSEEEDENAKELTQQLEKDFFKTLSYLKKKDPCIYDGNVNFFEKEYAPDNNKEIKSNKDSKPMFLRDYERKIIEEKNGILSDDDNDRVHPPSPTPVQEQEQIKQSFKEAFRGHDYIEDNDDNNDNALGGLFEKRKKSPKELKRENDEFREWLKGQQVQLKDKNTESDLKYLHDFWNDPKLDPNEQFLKDYILNKKFLEPEDKNNIQPYDLEAHDSDKGLSEDEATYEKQVEFEHKFNFRFEEPDQEFLKRFPRTMQNSMRKPDNRRKEKRKEVKDRKEAEKERMKEDLKRLKALKRNEIISKIEKLRQVTGNANFGFQEDDIDGHFDPDSYDKRMNELFSQDFYGQEDDADVPALPDVDEELELEKWDDWEGNQNQADQMYENSEPHCEDPDFIMDCDYNPAAKLQSEMIKSTRGRKRNKQSKLAHALSIKKPIFDPSDQSFEQYVDEYYGLDYEDVIGDLPCRFKYRKVVPNSFGLTTEEILRADDKELNQWCSVKLAVQRRPDHIEKLDIHKYEMKSRNENYKKKMLPSLYQNEEEDTEEKQTTKKAKKHKKFKIENAARVAKNVVDQTQEIHLKYLKNSEVNISKVKSEISTLPEIMEVTKTDEHSTSKPQITDNIANMSKKRKSVENEEGANKMCHAKKRAKIESSRKMEKSPIKKRKMVENEEGANKMCHAKKRAKIESSRTMEKGQIKKRKIVENEEGANKMCHAKKRAKIESSRTMEKSQIKKRKMVENEEGANKMCHTKKRTKMESSRTVEKSQIKKREMKQKHVNFNESSQTNYSSPKAGTTNSSQNSDKALSRRKRKNNKKLALKSVTNDAVPSDLVNTTSVVNSNNLVVQIKKKNRNFVKIHNKNTEQVGDELSISDARLQAYGLKPKKFKNYLKYGKTDYL